MIYLFVKGLSGIQDASATKSVMHGAGMRRGSLRTSVRGSL